MNSIPATTPSRANDTADSFPLPLKPYGIEHELLEGPHSRLRELRMLGRVMIEFIRGFRALHFIGPCITVFGSARFKEGHPYYQLGRDVGRLCSELGFNVMTGGGPGIMEAANRGAKESGGRSIACNIKLPQEQKANPYLDKFITFEHFFIRKVMLVKYSYAFIILPGGAGTMDEFFETVTLMQTKKITNFPLILMGRDYWKELIELFEEMVRRGTIDASELHMLLVTDSIEEARALLREYAVRVFKAQEHTRPRARFWLREKNHFPQPINYAVQGDE